MDRCEVKAEKLFLSKSSAVDVPSFHLIFSSELASDFLSSLWKQINLNKNVLSTELSTQKVTAEH